MHNHGSTNCHPDCPAYKPLNKPNGVKEIVREYKEEDGLTVDKESKQIFLMAVTSPQQHYVAQKCIKCEMVTSHSMIELSMYDYNNEINSTIKRVIGCQNCSKISTK